MLLARSRWLAFAVLLFLASSLGVVHAKSTAEEAARKPEGYVKATLVAIGPSGNGPDQASLVLANPGRTRILSLVANLEAAAGVYARHTRRMTGQTDSLVLLDEVLLRAGFSVGRVQIDSLKGQRYQARLFLFDDEGVIELACRPSDGIAIATKHQAPIYLNDALLKKEGEAVPKNYKFPPIR